VINHIEQNELDAAMARTRFRFKKATARFLPGEWPAEMRSDVVAAFLDYPDTKALSFAIERGEAPRPTSSRHISARTLEPVWSADIVAEFVRRRHALRNVESKREDLEKLVPVPTI
jgi:hypothetical protein